MGPWESPCVFEICEMLKLLRSIQYVRLQKLHHVYVVGFNEYDD